MGRSKKSSCLKLMACAHGDVGVVDDDPNPIDLPEGKRKSCMEPNIIYSSTKNLLSNGFAHQLLESAPKTKPIYISCDPSKSDSAWKWLERWMSLTPSEGPQNEKNFQGNQGQEESSKRSTILSGHDDTYSELSISSHSKLTLDDFTQQVEDGMHSITQSSCDFEKDVQEPSQLENQATGLNQKNDEEVNVQIEDSVSLLSQMPMQTDKTSELVHDSISDKLGSGINLEMRNVIIDSSLPDALVDSSLHDSHFHSDPSAKTKGLILLTENSFSHDPKVAEASECGTEISITSTLDSSDQSEAEGGEILLGLGSFDRQKYDANGGSDVSSVPGNVEAQPERFEDCDKKLVNSTAALDTDRQPQKENSINTTTPELHATPSSQNSVNAKMNKRETTPPDGKLISQISKRSPRSGTEQLQKDSKNAKRRKSMGLDKPDRADQEPRMSTSDSLPSYMQVTESARAKAHSPKSSPDFHSKDNNLKKRYSLPIANGKQGSSPRMQRSPSQAQQGNSNHSPHKSAERRWQR